MSKIKVDFGRAYVSHDDGQYLSMKRKEKVKVPLPRGFRMDFEGKPCGLFKVIKDDRLKIKLRRRNRQTPYVVGREIQLPIVQAEEVKVETDQKKAEKELSKAKMKPIVKNARLKQFYQYSGLNTFKWINCFYCELKFKLQRR